MTVTERDDLNKRIAGDLGIVGKKEGYLTDFFTDPSLTLLLLGEIPNCHVWRNNSGGWSAADGDDGQYRICEPAETIGEAVALAYLAMRGLK